MSEKFSSYLSKITTPIQLLALCVWAILQLSRVMSPELSVISILVIVFVVVWLERIKYSTQLEMEKEKLKASAEVQKTKIFYESTKDMTDAYATIGAQRIGALNAYENIISVFKKETQNMKIPEEEREFYSKVVKRLEDMRDARIFG